MDYAAQCDAVTDILRDAAAHERGSVFMELTDDARLPESLRGREIPVSVRVSVQISPGRRVSEKAVVAYATEEDVRKEEERRRVPVRRRILPIGALLEYAAACRVSVRFVAAGCRFTLVRSQIPYIRSSAVRLLADEADRKKREREALRAAFVKERKRTAASGNRFFAPLERVTAAVDADLPEDWKRELAVRFLRKDAADPSGLLLIAGTPEEDLPAFLRGRFIPLTGTVKIGKYEKTALLVWLSDESSLREQKEKGGSLPYETEDAADLLELVRKRKCALRLRTFTKELVIPYRFFASEQPDRPSAE